MSNPSNMQQFYTQRANNNNQSKRQQIQKQQQTITDPQTHQACSGQFKNVGKIITPPATATIDLLSSPSSPVPPTVQENLDYPFRKWELTIIPERTNANDTSNNSAYKVNEI